MRLRLRGWDTRRASDAPAVSGAAEGRSACTTSVRPPRLEEPKRRSSGTRAGRRSRLRASGASVSKPRRACPLGTSCERPPARDRSPSRSCIRDKGSSDTLTAPIDAPDGHLTPGTARCSLLETSGDAVATARQHDARRHSQTDNEHDPCPIIESIGALTPAASTTAADGQPRGRARHRHRAQRVESDVGDRPQPARGTPSSARRPDRLAFYMGCCPHRREDRVSRGGAHAAASQLCVERQPESAAFAETLQRAWLARLGGRLSRRGLMQ
jgi:hypothetical protein